ncbi:hypothetical protein ERX37_07870 [Macrococcus hajekii]|uniref:RNA polymerase sigma factor 70 region 4 type 2 domain-containing protein n=3 Tax=Macrococcus hajekii TaxID=198482 RepID=A0A4R6BIK7_9STAP|nr:hypothetical protein ERX37_07870 [Macrococcus hajekii]
MRRLYMKDLLIQYLQSADDMKRRIDAYKIEHADVIEAYKKQGKESLGDRQKAACPVMQELTTMNGMYNELLFVIEWLRIGHNPNVNNAIERRQVYLVDQQVLEVAIENNQYVKVSDDEYTDYISNADSPISHALRRLSPRELEVFIMMKCEGMSAGDVAQLLHVRVTSVESYLERAKKKIDDELYSNLFLVV